MATHKGGTLTKAIVVISDVHTGSIYGLMPPNFTSSDDRPVALNAGQKFLYECWKHFVAKVAAYKPVAIVANGDLIDGLQPAQRGTELCLPMLADQSKAAQILLKGLLDACRSPKLYVIAGTAYHTSPAAREEEVIAETLHAQTYKGAGTGRYVRQALDLDVDGVHLNFAHAIGVTTGSYRATAIDKEALFATLAGREGKVAHCDGIVRSHVHSFTHVELPHKHALTTPCWQLQTEFCRKKSQYRMLPDVGGIVLWVDGAAKRAGEDGIRVEKVMYGLPAPTVTKL